jgi:hypothetical protein
MRTSFNMLSTNYFKKNEDNEQVNIINKNIEKITKTDYSQQQPTARAPRDGKAY